MLISLHYLSYLFSLVYRVTFWSILWILLERSLRRNQKKYLLKNFRFVLYMLSVCLCYTATASGGGCVHVYTSYQKQGAVAPLNDAAKLRLLPLFKKGN